MFIGSMTRLKYLDLSNNNFTGTVPMFIGSMTQLRYLYLGLNDFIGTIPSEFQNLTNLQELSLESLNGCTIENLDWLSHLEGLDMSSTSLGKVDNSVNEILSLKKLLYLSLDSGGLIVQIGVARATPQPRLRRVKIPLNSIFVM
ncbi:putative non-specific serine/threonine protein kinase [Helianthus annuus]|uniref:Non-specific serine/threonine protein kinase n=1 Tax=Helianthus annuus TaxID=4232 RepID=A0A251VIR1_HELAN|nr:putative non-specific serine/threonine protein kinase [Helianthus annuus]KAJ0606120.1 putative non-specific serine/threonine protein kinase [Helianthus annuus]KAJ0620139.1 putative non-specific serine/threonine protein kinase [Helianthus annuus]KAJ0787547.1 putative non-specific serine/threonine protein kinase [Helianthus annuus]KAJ0953244.1 putative non-specific serine/threonine protein kinase [Helianthus annuus]